MVLRSCGKPLLSLKSNSAELPCMFIIIIIFICKIKYFIFIASMSGLKSISPPLANNLALLSRELVDLLKTCTHCTMSFNRFIPAYHHHFGRQCRVADYGFTKLIDLLEALPNIVQVVNYT